MEYQSGPTRVTVNTATADALYAAVDARFATGDGFGIATLNLDHLVKLRTNTRFQAAYAAHDLVVADGNPVVWLSRLGGQPVELLPGSDLMLPLARRAAAVGAPIGLVGATPEALAKAADWLRAAVPGLTVAAEIAPPFGFDPDGPAADRLFEELGQSDARLVFLALGSPKQEILAARGRSALPGMGFASIGAGVDFLAGTQRRAPRLVRRLALEWAWRLALNPRRLALRYLRCALILPGLALNAARGRGAAPRAPGPA